MSNHIPHVRPSQKPLAHQLKQGVLFPSHKETEIGDGKKKPVTTADGRITDQSTQDFGYSKQKAKQLEFSSPKQHIHHIPGAQCPACEAAEFEVMKISPEQLRLVPFDQAVQKWYQEIKQPRVRQPRTEEVHRLYIKNLIAFFQQMPLCQIGIGSVLEYQRQRAKVAGSSYVNHETNFLAQLLSYVDLWEPLKRHFRPLDPPPWQPPRVLTEDEEERFFRAVAANPQWKVAYWAVSITNNTSAHGGELRSLQVKHIFLDHSPPKVHVIEGTKNDSSRPRPIPLNEVAEKQVRRLLDRAEKIAKQQGFPHLLPDHYLFPYRIARNRFDVTKPASPSFIRRAFREMREVTGLEWLQPKTFRKQLMTRLFEYGASDETIESIAGWRDLKQVKRFYSGRRLGAKFEALSAVAPKRKARA